MTIKINGIDVSNRLFTEQGYIVKDTYTFDDLDSKTYNFYFNDDVEIKASDIIEIDTKQWVVGTVDKSISEKKPIRYKASIICLELTKLLERFILSPCAFTNKNDSMMDQVLKALDKAVLRRNDEARIFTFDTTLLNVLFGVLGEDFFFNELTTLREVLDTMLSTQKYRIEIIDITNGIINLGARSLKLAPAITTLATKGLITKRELHSLENYGSQYETMVDNVYPLKDLSGYNLIQENWQTLKPVSNEIVNTNNAQLVLSFPIEQLIEARMQWEVSVRLEESSVSGFTYEKQRVIIDISDMFIEEDVYNALPITEQEKHFTYSKGSTSIGVLKSYKILLFPRVALSDKMSANTAVAADLESRGYSLGTYPKYSITKSMPSGDSLLTETLFKLVYKSYQNQHYSISKDNGDAFGGGTILQNPNTSQIDSERFGTNMLEVAKSGGNRVIYYDYIHDNISDVMTLGTRVAYGTNSILTLTERELAVYKGQIKAHYMFELDFVNPVNAKLNRERRAFVNPINNFVKRDILIKDKVIIQTTFNNIDTGLIKRDTLNYAFRNTLDHTEETTEQIDLATMYTPYGNYQMQMHGIAIANSIRYTFGCLDNYSVGFSTATKVIGGYSVNLNPYVNAVGELEDLELDIGRSYLGVSEDVLSFANKLAMGLKLPLYTASLPVLSNKTKFKVRKDTFEQLRFTYQMEFIGSDDVIIGNELLKLIELVNGNMTGILSKELFIYTSEEKYYKTDTKYCKGTMTAIKPAKIVYDVYADISNNLSSEETMLHNAWAIGTDKGELLIAVNNMKENKRLISLQVQPYKTTFNV